jgi:hypothetical protein
VAYDECAKKKLGVFEWDRRFKEGPENVQDGARSGKPKTRRTDSNVNRVRTLVRSDQRVGVRLIADELNMGRKTVRQIIRENLGMRKNFCKDGVSNLDR